MRCEEIRSLLSAGLDGELDKERNVRVEHHLRSCALCAAEQQALSATVQLLRALPEADPPQELRGRIAVALTKAHRRSERRWLHLGWLARPQAAGWAWGAALGAVIATGGLIATHRPASPPTAVVAPLPSSPPLARPILTPPQPRQAPVAERPTEKSVLAEAGAPQETKPADPEEAAAEDVKTAAAPKVAVLTGPPELKAPAASPASAPRKEQRSRPSRAPAAAVRSTVRTVSRTGPATPAPAPRSLSRPGQVESASDEVSPLDRTEPLPVPDAGSNEGTDTLVSPDTTGMTQMASGVSPMESPAAMTDDLVELRRRLIERPLQVPQLGVMKPRSSAASSSEGWIRF